jgi:hypothetical protein
MRTLKVYPNPWAPGAVDQDGDPCGLCPRDPDADGGGPGQFVGAQVDPQLTVVTQKLPKGDDIRSPIQTTKYRYFGVASSDPALASKLFAGEPVEIPATNYYRACIRDRSLIAADVDTANAAGVKFCEPAKYAPEPAAPLKKSGGSK